MTRHRQVWAEVDHDAIRHNVRALVDACAPAALMAVVKADAYGHGSAPVARTVLAHGAVALGVATVEEGVALRGAGIDAPIVLLSEPPADAAAPVVAHALTPVVYSADGIDALGAAARSAGREVAVHLKIDTGMHRVGCRPEDAVALAGRVRDADGLDLDALMTHLAVADEPGNAYTDAQIDCFEMVRQELEAAGFAGLRVHAANSAGAIAVPRARYDMVRAGIAVYGLAPSEALRGQIALRPALSLHARVSHVQHVDAGTRISYGLRWEASRPTTIATIPIGYADGVPRRLGAVGGEVLLRGRRFPIAGTITMDQLMVDVGDEPVEVGDHAVLIGAQGGEEIGADDWARRLDTIGYEIVSGVSARVPREHVGVDA